MARPRVHDAELRLRLIEHAGRTVAVRGAGALSLRALAAEVGTSTSAVYALFGGKPGLLGALFEAAFAGFGAAQRAAPVSGIVLDDLAALGRAYWVWARDHPHLYRVMFGQVLVKFEPTPAQGAASQRTIQPLADAVHAGVESGVFTGDPATITFAIWAAVHGVVSLAMAGFAPMDEAAMAALFDATTAATLRGWLTDPPALTEPRSTEPRSAEPRSAEPRSAEPRSAEPRSAEPPVYSAPARSVRPG